LAVRKNLAHCRPATVPEPEISIKTALPDETKTVDRCITDGIKTCGFQSELITEPGMLLYSRRFFYYEPVLQLKSLSIIAST